MVIPYGGGGREQLRQQLDAVYRSVALAYEAGYSAEVVVAANSDDALREIRLMASESPSLAGFVVADATAKRGPSFARNEGVRASSGTFLLFCDADDAVEPGWVIGLSRVLETASIAAGVRVHDRLNDQRSSRGWSNRTETLQTGYHHLPFGTLSNLGIRRDLYLQIGGCDESFVAGEDVDLCWRAQYAGGSILLAPDAIIQYRLRTGLRAQFRQAYGYGFGDALLLARHQPHGARRTGRDSLRAIAGGASQAVKFLLGYRRPVACYVLGHLSGRVIGSARHGVWAV